MYVLLVILYAGGIYMQYGRTIVLIIITTMTVGIICTDHIPTNQCTDTGTQEKLSGENILTVISGALNSKKDFALAVEVTYKNNNYNKHSAKKCFQAFINLN
jgi:hypothetical protein